VERVLTMCPLYQIFARNSGARHMGAPSLMPKAR
jgi:hypothetical protein